jgi:replicative DNA helicase
MAQATADEYARRIKALLALEPEKDQTGKPCRRELKLSKDARGVLTEFMTWLEPQLAPGAALGGTDGWGSKLAGATARVAGLLHFAEYEPSHAIHMDVSADTMKRAVRLSREYLIPHALAVLSLAGANPIVEDAKRIVAWLTRGERDRFTRADAYRDLRNTFDAPKDLDEPLNLLVEHCYLRLAGREANKPGRRPDAEYFLNPRIRTRNTRNDPATETWPAGARSQLEQSAA